MAKVDVIVLGATGYTGQRVCEYLQDRAVQTGQSWAVAGRRRDALDALAEQYGAASVIVADCTKEADCAELATAGKVILNLAGPYYHRAEILVEACARAGTHYLDLTGELVFVRDLIDRFHETAVASGAKIVPVAGYESLPFDLTALALLEAYIQVYGESPERIDLLAGDLKQPEGSKGIGEMISGGTAETMRVMLEEDFSGLSSDPTALNPADDSDRETVRRSVPYRLSPQSGDLEPNSMPIFPGPFLHPAIVNRTFALLRQEQRPISPTVRYRERMSSKGMGPDWARGATAWSMSVNASIMGWLISTSMKTPRRLMKSAADRFLPKPGEGPDVARLDDWSWALRGRASGPDGKVVEMGLKGHGHPGYRTTANMIAEAGLILADPDARTPTRAGVLTPALALGVEELDRFAPAGMVFSAPSSVDAKAV